METLSIVIPAYNEESRLPRTFGLIQGAIAEGCFKSFQLIEIIIVNDGSTDQTSKKIKEFQQLINVAFELPIQSNQGKGNALHEGLKKAKGNWVLIADADSATPWNQIKKLELHCPIAQVIIASRDLPDSQVQIKQSWVREHMGKTFNYLVRFITGLPFKDTQCGFKLIHKPSITPFLEQLQVRRFAWDVEFLMFSKMHKLTIQEVAVLWEHQEASRVHPIFDATEMLLRVIQLRIRLFCIKLEKK